MNRKPLVSIIIPVYNGADYVREAINSALNQTYKNIEILIVNDGSNDNGETERIAFSYGDSVRYFYKENGGVSSALNLGIREMRGDYFSWLSHDDMYLPEKIEKQVSLLTSYKGEELICYCNDEKIDKNGNVIKTRKKCRWLDTDGVFEWEYVVQYLFKHGSFNGCGLLIPKKVFVDNNLFFDETMRYAQDALMWYRIFLSKKSLVCTNFVGVKNRIHEKQLTQTGRELLKRDAYSIAKIIKPLLIKNDNGKNNLIYLYIKRNVIQDNREVVKYFYKDKDCCIKLSFLKRINLFFLGMYGKIRPAIRRVYYKVVRKIKTN